MKNHANIAPDHRTPTPLAVDRLRSLNSRSGTSGARTCDSIARKIPNTTAAALSTPSVRADVHPFAFPLTIA